MFIHTYIHNKCQKLINKMRICNLKLLGAKIGSNVKSYGRFTVMNAANLTIGDNSTLNEGVHINCRDKVRIGKGVRISTNVQIHTGKLIINSYPRIHTKAPIIIEDNVWIASGSVISAGVKIGKNSVIGANSVVLKDVESNSFYAGNPAKKIKNLKVE
jgi:acetyltransferase-like isoleucine patch superfamily enzyme